MAVVRSSWHRRIAAAWRRKSVVWLMGANLVVASDVDEPFSRRYGALAVRFVSLRGLIHHLGGRGRRDA